MSKSGNYRRIGNIEFAVSDIARSRAFYGKAFHWTFTDHGPEYCEFTDGRLTGGLARGTAVTPGGPLVILYADDLGGSVAWRMPARASSSRQPRRARDDGARR